MMAAVISALLAMEWEKYPIKLNGLWNFVGDRA
jgi:hypothetical protein